MIALAIIWALCSLLWVGLAVLYIPTIASFSPASDIIGSIIGFIILIALGPITLVIGLVMYIICAIVVYSDWILDKIFKVEKS